MTDAQVLFLHCVRAGLQGQTLGPVNAPPEVCAEVLALAEDHKLVGLVLDVLLRSGARLPEKDLEQAKTSAVEAAVRQQVQENELLDLLLGLRAVGVEPLVVKGAVCRTLYPNPLLRPSVDEDLFLSPADAETAHELLLAEGYAPDDPQRDPGAAEYSYHKPGSPSYLELHTALLDPDSPVFGPCNRLFAESLSHPASLRVQDVSLLTLAPTEHLLFLLLHAYKHFLHSGFGIRLVCDIGLFSQRFAPEIDFEAVIRTLGELRCGEFAGAIYGICSRHLGLDVPPAFSQALPEELPLLEDILSAGLHGSGSMDRLHSATLTLQTVAADRTKGSGAPLRTALFPGLRSMERRFPYLKGRPWLLPVAWVQRWLRYAGSVGKHRNTHPAVTMQLADTRIRLLQTYHIIGP